MPTKKEFDVIIWGATGFTGRLVAEYYLERYGLDGDLSWAMAGRSQSKLEQVRASLGNTKIPLIVADSHDQASIESMVQCTKVICTTVGPYALYGDILVEACAKHGTDYVDLAGETQWIRRMIDQHNETAQESGARIVHCCGFDSIPSDLGTLFLQNEAKARRGNYAKHVKVRVKSMKGAMSGGTYASMNNVMAEANENPAIFKVLFNPYGLNPQGEMSGPDKGDLKSAKFDKASNNFIMPFIMAAINTRVVRRSHALLDYPYGKDFRYDEAMMTGSGLSGRLKAYAGLAVLGAMMAGKPDSFYKKTVNRFFPEPGEGPNKQEREAGFWDYRIYGVMPEGDNVVARVTGDRDPGYGSTSKMLGESAVCLALDKRKLPRKKGVLTPASAMGNVLIERLQSYAGLSFEILKS